MTGHDPYVTTIFDGTRALPRTMCKMCGTTYPCDAVAIEKRVADWLVSSVGFPFDVVFDEAPPVSPLAVARAWRNAPPPLGDLTVSEEDWLDSFRAEMGDERFRAWEEDAR